MRTRKLWNQIMSLILVLALLPVSALAQYGTDSTKDARVINEPKFKIDRVYVDPQMEQLGLKIDRLPEYDFSALGSKTVNSLAEAGEYLREQFVNREEAITVTINNYQCDSQEQFDGDIAALQDALLAHTGVPTQGDYIARHLTTYGIRGGLTGTQLTLNWTVVYKTTAEHEEVVDARVDELIAQWDAQYDIHDLSDVEKVTVIYDYICENVVYDYDHLTMGSNYPLMFSAYAALIDGKAVCQGYSNLFYRLALELGVDTRIISGIGNGGPHSWNITELGGSYYYLDSTWDAPRAEAGYPYEYFLLGSEKFLDDHSLDAEYESEAFRKEYPISKEDYDFDAALIAQAEEAGLLKYLTVSDLSAELTRLEAVKLLVAMMELEPVSGATLPFADCDALTQEEKELVAAAVDAGIINGVGPDAFDPYAKLTKAALATVIYRALGEPETENSGASFPVWYLQAIIALQDLGIITEDDITSTATEIVNVEATLNWLIKAKEILDESNSGGDGVIASGTCGDQLEWVLTDDGTLTISGTGEMYNYGWNLYDYNGAPWFVYREHIKTIVIGDGVTGIGDYAFDECMSLADVTIPDSVQRIGTFAFVMCSSLTKIEIPVSVTSIGDYAFCDCGSLTTVYYGGTEAQWNAITVDVGIDPMLNVTPIFLGKDEGNADDAELITQAKKAGLLKYLEVTDLSAELTRLEAVKLLVAMMELEPVSGATLPFADCDALTQEEKELVAALVEAGIISGVGPDAFDPYAKLTYAQMAAMICRALGEPVENGPNWVVQAVVALKRLGIITGDSVSVNDIAQVRGALDWLIKAKVIFDDNNGGEEGIIASGECGDNLVWNLTADGILTISGTGEMNDFKVRNQPWYDYRQQITAVVVEEGVTVIGRAAFFSFWEITSVTLPDSLTSIGGEAFAYCQSLREIVIPAGVMNIGDRAFVCCSALPAITVAADNAYYCSVDGVLFNKDMTELILYPSGKEGTVYKIPDGVTRLGLFAFEVRDTDLVEVVISASVVDLNGAFERAETLTTITVDSENAFYSSVDGVLFSKDLSTLINYPIGNTRTEYKIPDGVTTIFEYAFEQSLNLRRVIIPDGVTTIGALAFSWCEKLVKVVLPVSLTEIGEGAFDECQMLSKAYYVGTEEQWNGIWISERNDYLLNAVVYEADEADIYELEIVDQGTCGDNLTWVLTDDGTLTISGTGAMDDYDFGGAPWYAYSEQVAVVVIEDGVTSIGDNAFVALRNFTSITIPASVTSIGDIAFFLCNALTTVYYGGTEAQWKAIEIGVNNDLLLNANVVCAGTDDGGDAELLAQAEEAGLLKYLIVSDLSAELTRLEAVKLLVAMMELEPVSGATLPFTDCDALTQEEKELVAAAVEAGIINGVGPDLFDPYAKLTKAALATVIYRALGEPETENSGASFPVWYLQAIIALQDLGIITEEDITTTAMEIVNVEATLNWLIKAKAIFEDNNGGGETGTQYEIHFYANGGKLIIGDKEYDSSKRMTNGEGKLGEKNVPAAPVREGYTFAGWYTAAGEQIEVTGETVFTENTELYAHWLNSDGIDINHYEIEFKLVNGGLFATVIPPVETANGFMLVFSNSKNIALQSRYVYFGDGRDMIRILPGDICDQVTILELTANEQKDCGTIKLPVPIRCEEEFAWPGNNTAVVATYNSETEKYSFSLSGLANGYRYAIGRASDSVDNHMVFDCDENGNANFTNRNCESMVIRAFTCTETNDAYVMQMSKGFAVTPGSYKIILDANGGELDVAIDTATTDENGKITNLPVPTREGYTFDGWFTAVAGGSEIDENAVFMTSATIYAQWTEAQHTHSGEWKHDDDNHWRVCEECGEQFDYAEHEWKLVEEFPASCRDEGYEIYRCECGAEKMETYEKLECNLVTIPGQDPTCTEWGWYEYQECTICGGVYNFKDIEPLDHDYDDGVVTKEPTITRIGETTYTCQRKGCGDKYTEEIPMLEAVARGICGENLVWALDKNGVLTIDGDGEMFDFESAYGVQPHSVVPMSETGLESAPWSEYAALITKVVIEEGVTSIGDNAFAACEKLTEVKIPETVTAIGDDVFSGCEALETVTYTGSEEQWNEIEIGEGNEVVEEKVVISSVKKGDVNGDGKVNGRDTIMIATAIANKTTHEFTAEQFAAADVNGDDKINGRDTIQIATAIANKTTDEL